MRSKKFADLSGAVIVALTLAAFAAVTLVGFFVTCEVEIFFSPDNNEHVLFHYENPIVLILSLAAALVLLSLLLRRPIKKAAVRAAVFAMLAATTAAGLWWVTAAKAVPYADSANVLDVARALSAGQNAALQTSDYFHRLIHQLGFLRYSELVFRLFGANAALTAMAALNVLYVDAAYLALVALARQLFNDDRVTFLTALLLTLCLQPVFLCTFLYGLLPGLAFGLWSSYFVVRCVKTERFLPALPAALLLALAVLLKKNNLILLVADVIVLLLAAFEQKRLRTVFCAVLLAAGAFAAPASVQRYYEQRVDTSFGRGTPASAWLVVGFSESMFCSGWYSPYPYYVLADNGYDTDAAAEAVRADLAETLQKFEGRPRYLAAFVYHKIASQWNEPSFQCIWSSAAGPEFVHERTAFVESLSYGSAGRALSAYWNGFVQLIYLGFCASLVLLLRRSRRTPERLLLPLTVLGIFLYHLFFEAKAQYAFAPYLAMFPYAAWGIRTVLGAITDRAARQRAAKAGTVVGPSEV